MWQKIIIAVLVTAAIVYIARRIYRNAFKGNHGACAGCPPGELKGPPQK